MNITKQKEVISNNIDFIKHTVNESEGWGAFCKPFMTKPTHYSKAGSKELVESFIGRGYTTKTSVSKENEKMMIDLGSKYGLWYYASQPVSHFNKFDHKAIIAVTDTEIVVLSGYTGCWTMSGEDYVIGRSNITTKKIA